ncbi:MAG: hypothetical protein LBB38_03235 [Puniceicoccales bacterium]|jgi:hypothetical protein|nr:hypothetical protein [Puniceicoccales bacterium]
MYITPHSNVNIDVVRAYCNREECEAYEASAQYFQQATRTPTGKGKGRVALSNELSQDKLNDIFRLCCIAAGHWKSTASIMVAFSKNETKLNVINNCLAAIANRAESAEREARGAGVPTASLAQSQRSSPTTTTWKDVPPSSTRSATPKTSISVLGDPNEALFGESKPKPLLGEHQDKQIEKPSLWERFTNLFHRRNKDEESNY